MPTSSDESHPRPNSCFTLPRRFYNGGASSSAVVARSHYPTQASSTLLSRNLFVLIVVAMFGLALLLTFSLVASCRKRLERAQKYRISAFRVALPSHLTSQTPLSPSMSPWTESSISISKANRSRNSSPVHPNPDSSYIRHSFSPSLNTLRDSASSRSHIASLPISPPRSRTRRRGPPRDDRVEKLIMQYRKYHLMSFLPRYPGSPHTQSESGNLDDSPPPAYQV